MWQPRASEVKTVSTRDRAWPVQRLDDSLEQITARVVDTAKRAAPTERRVMEDRRAALCVCVGAGRKRCGENSHRDVVTRGRTGKRAPGNLAETLRLRSGRMPRLTYWRSRSATVSPCVRASTSTTATPFACEKCIFGNRLEGDMSAKRNRRTTSCGRDLCSFVNLLALASCRGWDSSGLPMP